MFISLLIAGYVFEARPIAALARNLDCLAETTKCALDAYREHWKRDLGGLSAEDDAQLALWRAADEEERRVDWRFPSEAEPTRFPLRHQDPTLVNKTHIAAMQATSLEDYRARLSLLLQARAAEARVSVLMRFLPRYEKYFVTAKADLDRFAKSATELIEKKKLGELIDRAAKFYGVDVQPPYPLHFVLVPRPLAKSRRTYAQQIDDHSIIEVPFGDKPEDRLGVVFHEMFHFFYQSAPLERHVKIANAFCALNDPLAMNALSLMDEVLATAWGNGLVAQRLLDEGAYKAALDKKHSFDNDDAIDPAAKAVLPSLDGARALDAKFATQAYFEATKKALGPELARFATGLRSFVLAYDSGTSAALRAKLLELANASSMQSITPLGEAKTAWEFYEHLDENGVILLVGRDLDKLDSFEKHLGKDMIARLRKLAGDQTVWAYGIARSPKAKTYVVYGASSAAIERFLPKLFAQKAAFDGPLLAD